MRLTWLDEPTAKIAGNVAKPFQLNAERVVAAHDAARETCGRALGARSRGARPRRTRFRVPLEAAGHRGRGICLGCHIASEARRGQWRERIKCGPFAGRLRWRPLGSRGVASNPGRSMSGSVIGIPMTRERKATVTSQGGKRGTATRWSSLTWQNVDRWAGSRSVSRGRAYQRQGRVRDLVLAEDGRLLGTVMGGDRYVTSVWLAPSEGRARELELSRGAAKAARDERLKPRQF